MLATGKHIVLHHLNTGKAHWSEDGGVMSMVVKKFWMEAFEDSGGSRGGKGRHDREEMRASLWPDERRRGQSLCRAFVSADGIGIGPARSRLSGREGTIRDGEGDVDLEAEDRQEVASHVRKVGLPSRGHVHWSKEIEGAQIYDEKEKWGGRGDILEFDKAGGVVTEAMRYAIDALMLQHLNQQTIDVFGNLIEGWQWIFGLRARGAGRKK
ncbi:Hypothetical protein D9617_66g010530 [Elsinoe fawcettii]|nr:Hypothetical protein D9617_66g010530 [Elsinoe fawcettii]